jgi:acetoin utilization deacetylase AcuC-like enzyme
MGLTIITNDSCFPERPENSGALAHLGNRDRYNPSVFYDFPQKAIAALRVARELNTLLPKNSRFEFVSSDRVPALDSLKAPHTTEHINRIKEASLLSADLSSPGNPAFIEVGREAAATPGTYHAALHSVGAGYSTIDSVLSSPDSSAFALVWPPGHHAERDSAMGFCYFSNAGLAALYARNHSQQVRPGLQNRVAVIDIDHHRGNGTASVLCEEPNTLLIDLLYRSPYDETKQMYLDGSRDEATGEFVRSPKEFPYNRSDAELGIIAHPIITGANIASVEFVGKQSPDTILNRFVNEALPRLRSFKPDVILWSLGIDSVQGDPVGGLGNIPGSFYTMLRGVRLAFPEARHAGILEGGYERSLFADCLRPALLGLHDDPAATQSRNRYRRHFEP